MGMTSPSTFSGESLSWDLRFFNDINTDDEETEILTTLVRTSYLNYLQRSLLKNYDYWLSVNADSDDFVCSQQDILKCADFLEQKALRACMIASYYQKAMAKTVKEIKKSTIEGSLFSPLIEQVFDNKRKNCCDKGTQTSVSLTNCRVESPIIAEDTWKKNKEAAIDITLENPNVFIVNPCSNNVCVKDKENDGLEDLFNILMTSPNFSETNGSCQASPVVKKRKYGETSTSTCLSTSKTELPLPEQGNVTDKPYSTNLDERLETFAALFNEENNLNCPKEPEDCLDYESSEEVPFKLALDWKSEHAAQICNLKSILARLTPKQRDLVQKTFRELFGSGKNMKIEVTVMEEALSRKRTATLVVGALTPHYVEGKISSRNVFKSLAKKITDDILLLTYVADAELVNAKVDKYFENGRCINSEKDLYY